MPTGGLGIRSPDAAGAPCWPVSSAARAAVVGSAFYIQVAIRGRSTGANSRTFSWGQRRCLSIAGKRIDESIAAEMLRAVAPMAIEAAEEAERMLRDEDQDRRRIAELELQQAEYDASLAERRYAACDPDNRLIAAQLEKAWE